MSNRIVRWVSAGMMTAGLSATVMLGAGTAVATPGVDSGAGSADTSERTDTAGTAEGPTSFDDADPGRRSPDTAPHSSDDVAVGEESDEESAPDESDLLAAAEAEDAEPPADEADNLEQTADEADPDEMPALDPAATEGPEGAPESARDSSATPEIEADQQGGQREAVKVEHAPNATSDTAVPLPPAGDELAVSTEDTVAEDSPAPVDTAGSAPLSATESAAPVDAASVTTSTDSADEVTLQMTAAEPAGAATNARPRLINVLGTIAFGVLDFMTKMLAGPATVPNNSSVRVARSELEIDCGDGYTAVADWYVPTGPEPPTGLIVLQHGFMAHGGFYNATAATLAEQTNSIVLAPTITSNLFACDSCHLTGDSMHFAIAKLFSGERASLNASLDAAFPSEDIALPQRYVLTGHSGGSQVAISVAGFASQLAGSDGSPDLAGVIMFETNDIGDLLARAIPKIPLTTPVYYLGGDPAVLNGFDEVNGLLPQLRPDQFTGLLLEGGTHWDIMADTNPVVQFFSTLLMGSPEPQNAAAAELVAAGWINDMFSDGADTGIYAAPGESVDIPTNSGTAHAVALGGPVYERNFFDSLIMFAFGLGNNLRFGYCAADVDALLKDEPASTCSA